MGVSALPMILSAGGTALNTAAQQDAEQRRIRERERGMRQQQIKQRQADERVNAEIKRVGDSTPEDERAKAMGDFMTQLRRTRGSAVDTSGVGGGRYSEDIGDAAGDVDQFGRETADVMSRITAPVRQRSNESVGFGRLSNDIGTISRMSSGDDFLTQLRANAVRANPWMQIGGELMQGAGTGMASTGFGAVPKTKTGMVNTNGMRRQGVAWGT